MGVQYILRGGDFMNVKRERLYMYVTEEMKSKIVKKSDEMGISVSAFLLVAVNEYMKQDSVIDLADMFRMFQKKELEKNDEA